MIGDIEEARRQLASVTEELARRPAHLIGTEWERDRLEERAWLTRAIERMEARRCAKA